MRHQRLDLNLLPALRALLAEKNVTRAAEALHVSQPAMSGILARLREYFDDALITPVGRRMELTPLGESLVAKVGDALLTISATLGTRPEFDPATSHRRFDVVASDYVVHTLLLDVLRDVHASAPHVTVAIVQASNAAFADVDAGEVDLAITPAWTPLPSVAHCELFDDGYAAVADRDHADVGDALTLEQYLACGHVAFENQGSPLFESWFAKKHGSEARRIEVTAPTFHVLPWLVLGTRRIATLHARHAERACAEMPRLKRVRLDMELPRFAEFMLWHKVREHDPGSAWLRERIQARARALPASV